MTDMAHIGAAPPLPKASSHKTYLPGESGIWVFVSGELLVFSMFFILIAQGQAEQGAIFDQSRAKLDLGLCVINTLLLLTGSWFVAIAVERCREFMRDSGPDKRPAQNSATRYFTLALLCALGFVSIKMVEWGHKLHAGITTGTNDFFMYYFMFTGIHLFHVLMGVGVLLFLRAASRRPEITPRTMRIIEAGATYWHLVDLLWVALFALLYLI